MDYIKIQTEFIKDRLNKKYKMKMCFDSLHERYGILNDNAALFIMIPIDDLVIKENTGLKIFDVTPVLSDFDENSEVEIEFLKEEDKRTVAIFNNGVKANKKYLDYFKGCKFYNVGFKNIIYAVEDDIVVGGVLPIR